VIGPPTHAARTSHGLRGRRRWRDGDDRTEAGTVSRREPPAAPRPAWSVQVGARRQPGGRTRPAVAGWSFRQAPKGTVELL